LVARHRPNHPNCDFSQPGTLFRKVFNQNERDTICLTIGKHMTGVPRDIQERAIKNFYKCDPEFGDGISKHLGFSSIKARL
jgi:catalase